MTELLSAYRRLGGYSNCKYFHSVEFWDKCGLLEGLDSEYKRRVSVALDYTAQAILVRYKNLDMMSSYNDEFDFVEHKDIEHGVFPLMRFVSTKHEDAYKFSAYIFQRASEEMNSEYFIGVIKGDESLRRHFLDVRHPQASIKLGQKPWKEGGYDGVVRYMMEKYGEFSLDWVAELTWCIAAELEYEIKKKIGDE
jgi:hypothetical protein